MPASSKEFLDIQATIECGFTLKRRPGKLARKDDKGQENCLSGQIGAERNRFAETGDQQNREMFKNKNMVKTNQKVESEKYILNDDDALVVSDEDKKLA